MRGQKGWISKIIITSLIILLSGCSNSETDKVNLNSQEKSDEKIEELEKKVSELTEKQKEEQREKERLELIEYESSILQTVQDSYFMLANVMIDVEAHNYNSVIMESLIDTLDSIEVIEEHLPLPPKGGEEMYEKGTEVLQSMVDLKRTIIVQDGQYFFSDNIGQSYQVVTDIFSDIHTTYLSN